MIYNFEWVIYVKMDFMITKIDNVMLFKKQALSEKYSGNLHSNELVFDFSGVYTVYFGDAVLNVAPNTIRFFPRGTVAKYEIERTTLGENIDIFFQTDKPISECAFALNASNKEHIGTLFKKMFFIWNSKSEGYYFECVSLLYKIFAEIQKNNYLPYEQYIKIKPAIDEINDKFLSAQLSNSHLAALCGISESYLKKLFKKRFDQPPKRYIIQKKLNYACELLQLNKYSISEISELCGFSDVYFFSRLFKKHTGVTPTKYTKKHNPQE